MKFLDSNAMLRYLTRDDEVKAMACYELFQRRRLAVRAARRHLDLARFRIR